MATQCPGTTCKTEDDAFVSIIDGIRKKALSHPDSPALSFLPDGKAENAELCSYSRLDMRARAIPRPSRPQVRATAVPSC